MNADHSSLMSWKTADENRYEQSISLKIPGYSHMHDLMERLLAASLTDNNESKILIAGAGGGKEITLLADRHSGWTFTGVDPSGPMLQLAKRRVAETGADPRVKLEGITVEELPLDELYDGATSMLMLHFLQGMEAKRKFMTSLAERLKSGGPLVLAAVNADLNSPAYKVMMNAWREHMLCAGVTGEEWDRFAASLGRESDPISSEQTVALLSECGFTHITRYFGAFWVEGYYAIRI
ncbi:class I SAM-dependent methyltransferase [Paenibacillus sp. P13VS]|uniref:class I SAM-dependent methyltransferase n=1 Tax=Paenibacillus sp. P13VS TaxID=2697367 RepID=UPI00187B5E54|nr:class I SAM-dependent methyltransferase [Paenibacillus sp. P13VS]MBE7678998.1 methyltransferase domain-containing protein [Paenibacillus sp. P13VS]